MKALDRYRNPESVQELPMTETHIRVLDFMDNLMRDMGSQGSFGPISKIVQRMRPALLRDIASVPEDQLRTFMLDLGTRMVQVAGNYVIKPRPPYCHVVKDDCDQGCELVCTRALADMVTNGPEQDSTPTT